MRAIFGELSVLHHGRREATVEATTPSRLLALGPDAVSRLLDEYPEFRKRVEERTALADYRRKATIPEDFAKELLPAEVAGVDAAEGDTAPRDASVAEELEPAAAPVARRRRRRLPHVYQLDEMDCGAACLAMVTRYFGKTVGLPHIRELVHTSSEGTSLLGLSRGAEALGLEAHNVRASKSRVDRLPLPALCHWEGNHWVVLYEVGATSVRIGDPARGLRTLSREEFDEKWTGYATLLSPTPAFEEIEEDRSDYRWLLQFLRPHRLAIAGATVLALVAAGLELAVPVFTQVIVDDAIPDGDRQLLVIGLGAMLAVLVAMVAATVAQRYILSRTAVRIDTTALDFLTGRLLGLPMSYFARRRTGDIERRLSGVRQVRLILVDSGVEGLTLAAQVVAALCLMLVYSWQLTLVYLAMVPLYALLMRYSAPACGRCSTTSKRRTAATRRSRSTPSGDRDGEGDRRQRRASAARCATASRAGGARVPRGVPDHDLPGRCPARDDPVADPLPLRRRLPVIDGALTLGEFVAFNALVLLTNGPVLILLSLWDELQIGRSSSTGWTTSSQAEPEQGSDRERLGPCKALEGGVRLRNSPSATAGPSRPQILAGITLDVAAGTTVALVGRSGSGKTTLVKLIAGLLEPTEGTVKLDGLDLATVDYRTAPASHRLRAPGDVPVR